MTDSLSPLIPVALGNYFDVVKGIEFFFFALLGKLCDHCLTFSKKDW